MKARHLILVLGFIAVVLIVFFIKNADGNQKYDWRAELQTEEDHVYGSVIIKRIFENVPGSTLHEVDKRLGEYFEDDELGGNSNYVFIGPALFLDSLDLKAILKFVGDGNKAFISSKTISNRLMDELYVSCREDWYWYDYAGYYDESAKLKLNNDAFVTDSSAMIHKMKRDSSNSFYNWSFIEDSLICNSENSLIPLGTMNDKINFVKQTYKNGEFYLHTTPLVFSNMHLLKDQNVDYANAIYAHLNDGDVYWDEFNKISVEAGKRMNNRNGVSSEGPLKYILQQPAFAWAWYLLLALGLLYVVFRSKRTQRVIPVLEPNKNTSLEFISTIGTMYFNQNDHKKLCNEQMKLFLSDVRERYRLNMNLKDQEFAKRLSQKTEVPEELINKILMYHNNISQSDFVSENTMIEFYQLLTQFTKTATIKNYAL